MSQTRKAALGLAVAALTFGITGATTPTPSQFEEDSLSTSDIILVLSENEPAAGQTADDAADSAKMGKEEGTHMGGDQGATPESETKKIDQPDSSSGN